jgi:hypothetical protein
VQLDGSFHEWLEGREPAGKGNTGPGIQLSNNDG